ncbi:MAG: PEGA domain-containing protein [Planctomycetota bacterium]
MRRSAAVLLLPLLTSCGLMFQPGPWLVPVDSEPSGATVTYCDKKVGTTPCIVTMWRDSQEVVLARDGFHSMSVDVGTRFNGAAFLNVIFPGVLGILVDAVGGGFYVVDQDNVVVPLVARDQPAPAKWLRSDGGRARLEDPEWRYSQRPGRID